ncbi:hypothetical protein KBD69_01555 [Candidatus Woesebacteria bacterium]|nr:hypothetical protein [Candidatus Woesebacteria bacterium]
MVVNLSERASETKRKIGRSVSVNGVHAVDVDLIKAENLNDPLLDLNIKVNNPIGRLWLALKRMWKSQNTVVALRFTIPLIVLPIALYVGYRLWQGRGVSTPMSKLGIIHEVIVTGSPKDVLVLPTSDVYMLSYDLSFNTAHRVTEKPVIVVGSYNHLNNELSVQDIIAYKPLDIPSTPVNPAAPKETWETILQFISQFR